MVLQVFAPFPHRTYDSRKTTGQQQQSRGLRDSLKLSANLSTWKLDSMNIEVRLTTQETGDEGSLSARHCSAARHDEGRVVCRGKR